MGSVSKQPNGRWRVQIRHRGLRSISGYFDTKQEAEAFCEAVEGRIEEIRKEVLLRETFVQIDEDFAGKEE